MWHRIFLILLTYILELYTLGRPTRVKQSGCHHLLVKYSHIPQDSCIPGLPLLFKDKDPISSSQMGSRCSRNVSRECYVCTYLCKTLASCHLFWWLLQGNGQPNPSGSFMWIHWTDPLSLNNNPIKCWETRAWLFRVVFLTERAGACLSHGALTE